MNTQLKNIFTYSGASLEETLLENSSNFHLLVHLTIGPADQDGGHDYSVGVCTPTWLEHNMQHDGVVWGRHLLIVDSFDAKKIKQSIKEIIGKCERSDWKQTSVVLGRYLAWEFEDYQA